MSAYWASTVPMGKFFLNSLTMASAVTLGYVATTTIAGYAVAKLRFPFKNALFAVLLLSLMVPIPAVIPSALASGSTSSTGDADTMYVARPACR